MGSASSDEQPTWPRKHPNAWETGRIITQLLTTRITEVMTIHPAMLRATIEKTVRIFTETRFDPDETAEELAALYWTIGARSDPSTMTGFGPVFQVAQRSTFDGLRMVLGGRAPGEHVVELQRRARVLVNYLMAHLKRGHRDAAQFCSPSGLTHEELIAEIHGDALYIVLAPTVPCRPSKLTIEGAILRRRTGDLLIPVDIPLDLVAAELDGYYVSGPPRSLSRLNTIEALLRFCAISLPKHIVATTGPITPSSDLIGYVIVEGIPGAAELLVEKHLSELSRWHPQQRFQIAQIFTTWLTTGANVNRIARDLCIAQQTTHRRLQQAQRAIQSDLTNRIIRVEILVALHSVLPRWAEEAEEYAKKRARKDNE
ncbi:hypothetical protein ACLM5J_17305 [Nocardioides sp. Bht2]|uniref:hypothetical protein n=1 Tax=Nocardioides sp. Bht2 TaxID=3392297 RepID=UPI0039B3D65C